MFSNAEFGIIGTVLGAMVIAITKLYFDNSGNAKKTEARFEAIINEMKAEHKAELKEIKEALDREVHESKKYREEDSQKVMLALSHAVECVRENTDVNKQLLRYFQQHQKKTS